MELRIRHDAADQSDVARSCGGPGVAAAQEIQLAIEYAPNPIVTSGTPESAPDEVLESFRKKYEPIGAARETEAIRYA